MNFCTHALESLKGWELKFASFRFHQDLEAVRQLSVALQDSVKFLLPNNGKLGVEIKDARDFNFVKMPYPAIAFEYTNTLEGSSFYSWNQQNHKKTITLVMTSEYASNLFNLDPETESLAKDSIVICLIEYIGSQAFWAPSFISVILDLNKIIESSNPKAYEIRTRPLFEQSLADYHLNEKKDVDPQILLASIVEGMNVDISIAVNALACLNAKNVTHVSVPPSEKVNAKRKRNGKLPFFEYKVLDIFLGAGVRKIPSGDGRRLREAMSHLLSSSMRLHTVRGHFKQRKTGLYWWSHFVRGRHEEGVVVKDYNVKIEGVKHEN